MRSRRVGVALALGLLALAAGARERATAAPMDETAPSDLYLRHLDRIPGTVDAIANEAKRVGATTVVVAFDRITFAPPPGENEFDEEHAYRKDLPAWLAELERCATKHGLDIRAGGTARSTWARLTDPGGASRVIGEVDRPQWVGPNAEPAESATHWIAKALAKCGIAGAPTTGTSSAGGLLVLVTSDRMPEDWMEDPDFDARTTQAWRKLLLPRGAYWDAEAIGSRLRVAACPLFVVAPEARFCDEMPLPSLPSVPWASRPTAPPMSPDGESLPLPGDAVPGPGGTVDPGELEKLPPAIRELLKRKLKNLASDPFLKDSGGRFYSDTPFWRPHEPMSSDLWFETDSPSGYGHWPYARAAAKSGGRYAFYPFPVVRFLDVRPADPYQLSDLSPPLVPPSTLPGACADGAAGDALLDAERIVIRDTPWTDRFVDRPRLVRWAAFSSQTPPAVEPKFRLRRKPFDDLEWQGDGIQHRLEATVPGFARRGRELAEALPLYEKAMARLDAGVDAMRAAAPGTLTRRARGDLLVGRFWFAMSAFHLHALSIYLQEVREFMPPRTPPNPQEMFITYTPTIRLSDCLDAYDGKTMPPEYETKKQVTYEPSVPRCQSNILDITTGDPNYRARRVLDRVLARLDPRLLRDARRMIACADDVIRDFARSPFGWVVYYSEAFTFVWVPVDGNHRLITRFSDPKGSTGPVTPPDKGGEKTPKEGGATTPSEPSTPRAPGSGSGGSTTK